MNSETLRLLALDQLEDDMTARRLVTSTRVINRDAVKTFFRWASQRSSSDLRLLGKKDLVAYHNWLCKQVSKRTGQALASTTINRQFYVVGWLFSCLYRTGVIPENPCHNLRLNLSSPGVWKRRPLSQKEITKFLESIDLESSTGMRDRCLFELIYSSGLRVGETVSLKVRNIDFDRRLMVVRGKFDKDRMVPLSLVARAFLVKYLGSRIDDPEAWIFPRGQIQTTHLMKTYINIRFKKLLKQFEMDKKEISAHSIRHSTATHLLESGASIRHVQELLGHANIATTARYTQVMTDSLAKIYRKHHPREHELFEVLDQEYEDRLTKLVSRKKRVAWRPEMV